jgi:HPt (histidine-containing phosphotransfer) domain-containing protein
MSTFQHSGTVQFPATDPEALTRLERFGGPKLLDEMIALFLENARERLAAALAGLDDHDAAAVEDAMHALKSSSAQLGALRLSRLCQEAETVAGGGTLTGIRGLLGQCRDELARVRSWLAGERAERCG